MYVRVFKPILILLSAFFLCAAAYGGKRDMVFAEIFYDTPLNESEDVAGDRYVGEYIKFQNVSGTTVDISGWEVKIAGRKVEIWDGTRIPPGGLFFLHYEYRMPYDYDNKNINTLFPGLVWDEMRQEQHQVEFYLGNSPNSIQLFDKSGNLRDWVHYGENGMEAVNGEGKDIKYCKSLHRVLVNQIKYEAGDFAQEEYEVGIVNPYVAEDIDVHDVIDIPDGTPTVLAPLEKSVYIVKIGETANIDAYNFIGSAIVLEPSGLASFTASASNSVVTVEYFDGLGRSLETVDVAAGGGGGDVAGYREYDGMGNVVKEFIPVPAGTGNGAYVNAGDYASAAAGFYGAETPYKEYFYESTAAPRVTESVAEGEAWHSHGGATTEYALNTASGELACVRYAAVKSSSGTALEKDGNYGASQLRVVKTKDEDGVTTLTFTDFLDRTVLVRQTISGGYADTYYVYDNYGQLVYILPPELSERLKSRSEAVAPDDDLMDKYAFIYEYDHRNRCTGKKLPGADWVRMVYDNSDLLIASEDGNQRGEGRHTVYAYDRLGRLAYTAEIDGTVSGADAAQGRVAFAPGGWIYGYDEINYDIDEDDALTVNYYDNYGFLDLFPGRKAELSYRSKSGYGVRFVSPLDDRSSAVGMLTGRLTACGDSVMVESFYYDHAGRVVQRHSTNHLGGYEHVYLALSFTGNPVRELREHAGGGAETISVLREYEYDGRDRLVKVTHRIGGGETRVLLKNSYDGVGRLAAVETNGGSYRTDYGYNVRGWLTEISSPLMEQTLNYTEHSLRKNPYMNGNINSITTKNNLLSPATGEVMGSGMATVTYMYDKLNRLESSTYEPVGRPTNPGAYNTAYTYDLNGNITMLSRQGINERLTDDGEVVYAGYGFTDQITATYDGNRLLKVTDNMEEVVYGDAFDFHDGADEDVEYEYDGNGNMTADLNRGIKEITYDVNNRPLSVTFSTRPAEQRTKYLYDASGRKLRTTYQTSRFASLGYDDWGRVDTMKLDPGIYDHIETGVLRPLSLPGIGGAVERRDGDEVLPAENLLWNTDFTRDYCGDIIYKDGGVERILTDNGYAVPDSAGGYDYYYYVKDWQGNVRAVIDEANRRMELNNYYPYGMPMSSTASVQPYKYGGKELDRTNGLDMYDFHARQYDPAFPHFLSIDTNAENYPDISPYAYCYGNPINIIDPLGTDTVHVDFDGYQIDPIKQGGEDVMFVTSFPELVVTGSFPNSASDATINSTMIIIGGLVADDVTGVGIANDAAIPIVFTAGALVAGGQQIYEYFNPPEPVTTSYYSYKPAPKKLPAYPDATPVKNKAGRKRWRLGNGDTAEWDSLHGELEVYDRNGNHKGAFDPKNGKQLKPGKKNRKLKK